MQVLHTTGPVTVDCKNSTPEGRTAPFSQGIERCDYRRCVRSGVIFSAMSSGVVEITSHYSMDLILLCSFRHMKGLQQKTRQLHLPTI